MIYNNLTLIIPEKPDVERDAVADVWLKEGGSVLRLGKFWDPPELDRLSVRVYGNDTFCLVLKEKLGFNLVSPADDFLLSIDFEWVKRDLNIIPFSDIDKIDFPVFIKPLIPKLFRASVYNSKADLLDECKGISGDTDIIVSGIIDILAEARAFVLDGIVLSCSIYEGDASVDEARLFAQSFLDCCGDVLPVSCVVDVGKIGNGDWVVVEANAAWGAGLNGCDAGEAARCLERATF